MKNIVKIKIIKLEYDKENNLFQMHIEEIKTKNKTTIAVNGEDWGITPDKVTDEIIKDFCEMMKNKEKNLHIEEDKSSIANKKDEKISQEELSNINKNMDNYPLEQIMNSISKEGKNEN